MSKYLFSVLLPLVLGLYSCQNEVAAPAPNVTEPVSDKISELTTAENQQSADDYAQKEAIGAALAEEKAVIKQKVQKPTAKISFEKKEYEFGMIEEGSVVKHNFIFKNTGKIPLLITNATSTCGCTIPEWPKEPISPGEKGMISATFDTKGKLGSQKKEISITANTAPKTTKVALVGFVGTMKKKIEKPAAEEIEQEKEQGAADGGS